MMRFLRTLIFRGAANLGCRPDFGQFAGRRHVGRAILPAAAFQAAPRRLKTGVAWRKLQLAAASFSSPYTNLRPCSY